MPWMANYVWQVWGSGDPAAIEARDVMQQRLRAISASEAKIDVAALFGYGSDGKQVCDDDLTSVLCGQCLLRLR